MNRLRLALVVVHRWIGLVMAIFLLIAGVTGSIIAFEQEIDRWVNPHVFFAESAGRRDRPREMTVFELADFIEKDGRFRITWLPLSWAPGRTAIVYVDGRNPTTGKSVDLDYNEIFVDPATGKVQARRQWGELSLRRECLLPMLYRLHYSLQLPGDWGIWIMGIVAIAWTLDCFIALWISFPKRKLWRQSLRFRLRQGGAKLNFDLHRSGGVWTWLVLLVLAFTSVYMNLENDVVEPIVEAISPLRKTVFDTRKPSKRPIAPTVGRAEIARRATAEARRVGITAPLGAMYYEGDIGVYGVGFWEANDDHAGHGNWGYGPPYIHMDGRTGLKVGDSLPGTGSNGARFIDLQFPLHSGRLGGLGGRIIVCVFGVLVSMFSITGIIVWIKKRGGFWRRRRFRSTFAAPRSPAG